jgi:hypothetical protein
MMITTGEPMSTLTPTARAILTHLREHPASPDALREATGRSRNTIDKTLTDLTHRALITQYPGDDGTGHWALTDAGHASIDNPGPDDTVTDAPDADAGDDDQPRRPDGPAGASGQHPGGQDATESTADGDHEPAGSQPDHTTAPAKQCRGCRKDLPPMCPTCWQKTPLYCGECRRTLPVGRRGGPSEPEILSNGLRKLMPGELEKLVLGVFRSHPVPDFAGVVGWNPGRIAIHLPGRSTGAINRVLDKLTSTGQVVLISTAPKYYRPVLDNPTGPGGEPATQNPPATGNGPDRTFDNGSAGQTGPDISDGQTGPDTSDGQTGPDTSDGQTGPDTSDGQTGPDTSDGQGEPDDGQDGSHQDASHTGDAPPADDQ